MLPFSFQLWFGVLVWLLLTRPWTLPSWCEGRIPGCCCSPGGASWSCQSSCRPAPPECCSRCCSGCRCWPRCWGWSGCCPGCSSYSWLPRCPGWDEESESRNYTKQTRTDLCVPSLSVNTVWVVSADCIDKFTYTSLTEKLTNDL